MKQPVQPWRSPQQEHWSQRTSLHPSSLSVMPGFPSYQSDCSVSDLQLNIIGLSPNSITTTLQQSPRHSPKRPRKLCHGLSSGLVTEEIPLERCKQICHGLVTNYVSTISTCQDGLKARNFPMTTTFHGLHPQLSWSVSVTFTETSSQWKSEKWNLGFNKHQQFNWWRNINLYLPRWQQTHKIDTMQ